MRFPSLRGAVFALAACCSLATSLPASADAARRLGHTRLTRVENDVDVLRFAPCRRGIDAVQLRVARGQVEVERLWVDFARGGREVLEVRDRIGEGRVSRWIDLRGGERCIVAVGIVGDTERSRDQARVEVWGR